MEMQDLFNDHPDLLVCDVKIVKENAGNSVQTLLCTYAKQRSEWCLSDEKTGADTIGLISFLCDVFQYCCLVNQHFPYGNYKLQQLQDMTLIYAPPTFYLEICKLEFCFAELCPHTEYLA
jgi:hypothetical protein